jgi:hypothetical protein
MKTMNVVMDVVCGVNGEPWTKENPLFVCHHCGMPVCLRDGLTHPSDEDFDGSDEPVYRAAMHCPGCARGHSGSRRMYSGGWVDPKVIEAANRENAKRAAAEQSQPRV